MTREKIFEVITNNIIRVLNDISPESITIEKRLKDLGADSIDRVEIMSMTVENMGLKMPLVELGRAKDITGLVEILYEKQAV